MLELCAHALTIGDQRDSEVDKRRIEHDALRDAQFEERQADCLRRHITNTNRSILQCGLFTLCLEVQGTLNIISERIADVSSQLMVLD